MESLRDWLEKVEQIGALRKIDGADWDLEIGRITHVNMQTLDKPTLLFDNIKGYPGGYRVLTCSTPAPSRSAIALNQRPSSTIKELLAYVQNNYARWEAEIPKFQPQVVQNGPILENVHSGKDINLFEFPTPKWNELDGGRYIGTAHAVITRDPDNGEINLGTYRIMIHDEKTTGLHVTPAQHGRIHYEKYHARGERCPVAVSIGHNPLLFTMSNVPVPAGAEYPLAGAITGEPVKVITEEVTGLPIPADAEIVFAGWCPHDKTRMEGPFGEWTGTYAGGVRPIPIIEVERIYHRNNPILFGILSERQPNDFTNLHQLFRSAMMYHDLVRLGIPDVRGVWQNEWGGFYLVTVSIKQKFGGDAKRAGYIIAQGSRVSSLSARYVIVVDEDIDPTKIEEVIWAVCTRSDPEKSIDIIRGTGDNPLDTMARRAKVSSSSRAIINACKPFAWIDEFPITTKYSHESLEQTKMKWFKDLLKD